MLTGISGSNTADRASTMRGPRAACRAGSLVMPAVCSGLLGDGLALDDIGHERRRRLRDGAAGALKRRVLYHVVLDAEIHRQPIAAERVVAFGLPAAVERAKIPRPPVVIEDHFLVEVLEIG